MIFNDDESYPLIEVFAGIGRHHLSLSFYSADYDGDVVLSKDIPFDGELYRANERVVSSLEYDNYDFIYRYDVIDLENFLVGGSIGLVARLLVFDGYVSIDSTTLRSEEDFNLPLPMVGVNFHVGLLKDIIEARVLLTGISYSGDMALDGLAEISVTPFSFLDVHGGYRFFKIDVEEDDVTFDFENSGLFVALTVSF